MKQVLLIITLAITLFSCEKSESTNHSLSGRYMGIFSRTGMDTSQVSLYFDQDRFEGFSSVPHYPAICSGTFDLSSNTVEFTDTCTWTANFDWSLILSGTYNISFIDGTVRIWKNSGAVTDEYLLRQPTR
jgi:hypothetical protein